MEIVAVDIETHDPLLKQLGDGAIRKRGEILGVGMHSPTLNISGYFNPRSEQVREVLQNKDIIKVFHNSIYDMNWLVNGYGIDIKGPVHDTMTQEYLLDAYAGHYDLDTCCIRRGVVGKNYEDTIEKWWKERGGKGRAIEHLKEMPERVVGSYCVQDCAATYHLYFAQIHGLEQEGLLPARDMEADLLPTMMIMKRHGIKIDLRETMELSQKLTIALDNIMNKELAGLESLQSPKQLQALFEKNSIPLPVSEEGKVSFAAPILQKINHPLVKKLLEAKAIYAALHKFIDGAFHDYSIEGRLHPTILPSLRDEGGTITGRMASKDPNAQQISAREDKFGKEVRSLFKPDPDCILFAFDYSQVEYRVYMNYAKGRDAEEVQALYQSNPNTDYHQLTMDFMGWKGKEGRHIAKNCGFGSLYGLGLHSFEVKFGQPAALYEKYMKERAYIRLTNKAIEETARRRGYVRTLMGRKQRWPLDGKGYKMVNYLVQGSAADILKAGMVDADKKGLWEVLKPSMPVHDEIVGSAPRTKEGAEALEELAQCMCVLGNRMKIPLVVDKEVGPDWGHCEKENYTKLLEELNG